MHRAKGRRFLGPPLRGRGGAIRHRPVNVPAMYIKRTYTQIKGRFNPAPDPVPERARRFLAALDTLGMLGGEQGVSYPALRLVLDHHQPQALDIAHLDRHIDRRRHGRIEAPGRGALRMGTSHRQRNPSLRLQHRERLQAPGELRGPTGIDEAEPRADFAPQRGAALARALCHKGLKARSGFRCAQCPENLALEPHGVDYTRASFLCSASLVGTGQT